MFRIVRNRKKGICVAHGCTRNHTKKDRFCSKHRHRYNKFNNHLKYTYNLLKSNANKRKVGFSLTVQDFKEFCDETNYLELKGKSKTSMSIDRRDPEKGYEKGNLKIMSLEDNSRKMRDRILGRSQENDYDYGEDDLPF